VLVFAAGAVTPWMMLPGMSSEPADVAPVEPVVSASPPPQPEAPADPVTPRRIVAVGDRALHATAPCLEARGIHVYPRSVDTFEELIATVRRLGQRHTGLIIHMGERDGLVDGQIRQVLDLVGSGRRVVWATIHVPGGWGTFNFEDRTNASIRNVLSRSPDGRVLDWRRIARSNPGWTYDGIRPTPTGCDDYARRAAKLAGKSSRT
jgi:hypothetical protein